MAFKKNESTRNRPEGDRMLDAPHIYIDTKEYIRQLKNEPAWVKNDRNGITVFKTERLSLVLTGLHKDAVLDHMPIDGICMLQVLEGKVNVKAQGEEQKLEPGELMTFHSSVDHNVEAIEDSFILLTVDTALHGHEQG